MNSRIVEAGEDYFVCIIKMTTDPQAEISTTRSDPPKDGNPKSQHSLPSVEQEYDNRINIQ
jgi:hypothetical protein